MESPKPVIRLSDRETTIEIEKELVPYFNTFNNYPYDDAIGYQEDEYHQLPLRLWEYVLNVYRKHHQEEAESCPSYSLLYKDMLEVLTLFDLFDLYQLAAALDFYDSPLLLHAVSVEIVRRLLPLSVFELEIRHIAMPLIDAAAVVKSWANPFLSINLEYSKRLAVQDAALSAYGLNDNIIHLVHHKRPLTHEVIAVGGFHSVMITSEGLYGCGDNAFDQLGRNGGADTILLAHLNVDEVISVACGLNHTMAITTSGLVAMGDGREGQLGIGKNADLTVSLPRPVLFEGKPFLVVTRVACGPDYTMMVTSEGLYACGNNTMGQLGLGDRLTRYTPTKVSLPCNVEVLSLSLSSYRALLLTTDGLYLCGFLFSRSVSDDKPLALLPRKLILPVEMGKPLKVCTGQNHCILLTTEGLYGIGSNQQGQLALSSAKDNYRTEWQKLKFPRKQIKNIYAARNQTFVLLVDGVLMACGDNRYCVLGIHSTVRTTNIFTPVALNRDIISVAAGPSHTLFLTSDDGLYACGNNEEGQLGLGNVFGNTFVPLKIELVMGNEEEKEIK